MMQSIQYPEKREWQKLIQRPVMQSSDLQHIVQQVFDEIQKHGDDALAKYTEEFDHVRLESIVVSEEEINNAEKQLSKELIEAMKLAQRNIESFHASQREQVKVIETTQGVYCWRENRAIESVGLYIPGGSAPLFSTVLMLGIPAVLAGCKEIILCTPPDQRGSINPAILFAAKIVGIRSIYKIGGIQAIGAMTFGTQSIPKVNKIFGPGNQYVTAAKHMAQFNGIAIDMPAGPSEVLVIADSSAIPEFLAADLLSQAEHGADSQVILLSDDAQIISETLREMQTQATSITGREVMLKALAHSKAILFENIESCIEFSNAFAPEHLILAVRDPKWFTQLISNAGSVFLGNYSCESAGDYASGTNHTLPTNGYARSYSGVSLDSFLKKVTFQELTREGIQNIGPAVSMMAEAEHLPAHKYAVTVRLNNINRQQT